MVGRDYTEKTELESGSRVADSLRVIVVFALGLLLCWLFVRSLQSKYETPSTPSEVIRMP